MDTQKDGQTERRIDRMMDRQKDGQAERWTDRKSHIQKDTISSLLFMKPKTEIEEIYPKGIIMFFNCTYPCC